MSLNH